LTLSRQPAEAQGGRDAAISDPHALIGIDWGTSSFRAFRIDSAGAILDRRGGAHGILSVSDGDFAGVLERQIGDWLDGARTPVVMSGMIGSRQGWLETPYVTCPAGLGDLAAGLVPVAFERGEVRIVPGVETATASMRDVMRGEEAQVFGALAALGADSGRFLLPGTHSKWVRVEAGPIVGFSTYMTGEIYAALRNHTILGRLMEEGGDNPAIFVRGVRDGASTGGPGALLHRLFGVRTAGLFGEIPGAELPDYLSGLLIGAEIADAEQQDSRPVRIIASEALTRRYGAAAAELGLGAETVDPDCVAAGHLAIARAAGLVTA
jgi:2-dehydro-3-deoxygalactonokinase